MIRFETVTKRYGTTVAVNELDLVAPSGQITVLVGPSGCGKTTSLRMINRMISPSSGRILIDDRDTAKGSAAKLRRGIGYVIQHAGLFPHRTVLDNVATVPFLLGVGRKKARSDAMELLERVGLPAEFAARYPAQLSGGQQQRVGVARALAADPPVMLMDEPFSAVDPVVRGQLQDEFLRLQSELHKTIVFVTHDIDEAIKMGDQVAVLRVGGHLAQLATPAALLSTPADAFVAGFVGRDRGYRALGFAHAGSLPLRPENPIELGAELSRAASFAEDGWVLVIDGERRPVGWLAVGMGEQQRRLDGQVTPELLNLGGTLATEDGTLREALDAALSSPSGRGVVVTAEGRFAGTITAVHVLTRIEAQAKASRAQLLADVAAEPAADATSADLTSGGITSAEVTVESPSVNSWDYFRQNQDQVLSWLGYHAWLSTLPVAIGLVIALPLGWLANRYRWTYPPIVGIFGLLYTVPSLALFVFLPGLLHTQILDEWNVVVALSVYSVALLVRVIADGLASVPFEVRQSALAMGFRGGQRFVRVELPLAIPVITAGLRVAVVSNVSLVAIAAIVGVPQLGQLFTDGFQRFFFAPIILGIVLCAALALVFDLILVLAARWSTPWRRAVNR